MSDYLRDVLGAEKSIQKPAQPQGLVADAGPDIPGGEGANKGFWRRQIKDAKGRWARMFGNVVFEADVSGFGKVKGHGKLKGISKPGMGLIRVKNHPVLPDGDYEVSGDNFVSVKAIIPDQDFERLTGRTAGKVVKARIPDADFKRVTGEEPVARIYPLPDIAADPSIAWYVDSDNMPIPPNKLTPEDMVPENLRVRDKANNRILDGLGREVKFKFENRSSADPRIQEVRHETGFIDKNEITEADVIRDVKDPQELYELMYDGEVVQAAPEVAWNAFRIAAQFNDYIGKDENPIGKDSPIHKEVLDALDTLPAKQKAKILRAVVPSDLNEEKARRLIDFVKNKNGEALTQDEMRSVHRQFRNAGVDLTNLQIGDSTNYTQNNLGAPRGLMPQLGDKDDANLFRKYCADNGIKVTDELRTPDQLTPIQSEMDMGKVGGIAQGFLDPESRERLRRLPIYVTRDGYVIDGHHRWAAALIAQDELGEDIELNTVVLDIDHGEGIRLANEFTDFAAVKKADLTQKEEEKPTPKPEVAGEVGMKANPSKASPLKDPPEKPDKKPIYKIPDVGDETDTDGKPLQWYVDKDGVIVPSDKLTSVDKTKANHRIRDIQNNRVLDGYGRIVEFTPEFKDEASPTSPTRHEGGFWDLNEIDPDEVKTDITDPQEAYEALYDMEFVEVDKEVWVEALRIAAEDRPFIGADENAIGPSELADEVTQAFKNLSNRQYQRLRRAISPASLNEKRANELLDFLNSKKGQELTPDEMKTLARTYRTNGVDVTNMRMRGQSNYTNNNLGAERGLMPQLGTEADQRQFEAILDELGIKYSREKRTPDQLSPVQSEMDMGNVGNIAKSFLDPELRKKYKMDEQVLYVTRDGYVIDGHHRWAGALAAQEMGDKPVELNVVVVDLDHEEALKLANEYNDYIGVTRQTLGATSSKPKPAPKRKVEGQVGRKGNPPEGEEPTAPASEAPPGPAATTPPPKALEVEEPKQATEIKDEISGDEALKTIRSAVAKSLKEEGRFPVIRSDADIEKVVSEQYKGFFDQIKQEDPELLKVFGKDIPDADLFWEYLKSNYGTDLMTRYVAPKDLPPLMKRVNQLYAEKFLGVKKDGLISFYRNNIREKDTEADAAAGYASLDRYMAFDYNVDRGKYERGRNTGRYEIKAKPDEINGLLGFSRIGDEIGAVISPEVTSIPGRVTRLGDLEIPDPDNAPWFDLKNFADFDRSTGGSPFRQHRPLGQFDYYGLDKDPFGGGEDWASFYETHGLEKGSLPAKYDELYGEGAWERDWEQYRPSAKYFKALFKEYTDKDGKKKWGLQGQYLWNMGSTETDYSDPKANDGLDKHLKFLSTMQELIGKPFFVSRGHDPNDPRLADVEKPELETPATPEVETKEKPLDFSKFNKTSGPLGSNPGGIYENPSTGEKYYVKIQDKERGDNEALASALYREVGLDALEVKYGVLDGNSVTYTEWRDGLTPLVPKWNDLVLQDETDKVVEGFLIDAWIANWDVVGTGYDNISIDKNNNPVRLDSGGSLLYRARGARKGDAFGNEVNELKTFKDPSNTTERIYGSMYLHPEGERASYEKLKSITPERIDELVDQYISNPKDNKELKEKLKARQKFILDSYKDSPLIKSKLYGSVTTQNVSKEEKSSIKNYTNAGYLEINKYLRDPENPKHQGSKKAAENINNIIKANTLNEDTVLHRITRNFDDDYEPGDIIEDLGIQSTTKAGKSSIHSTVLNKLYPELGPDGAEFQGYTTYTIKAPAGTAALDVTQMSLFRSEGEVLLPAGTKFKVISYERKPMGEPYTGTYRNIEVEIIPETVKEQTPKSVSESKEVDVESFDDSKENLIPKSNTVMVSEDGLTTIQPGQVIDMDVDGKTVPFRYTGTALLDIFSEDAAGAFGLYEGSYIFELTNSPDEKHLPNGFYLIYSDDIDTLPEDPSRLPEFFEEDHNVFIGTKVPIKRSYKEQVSINAYGGLFYRSLNNALNNNLDLSTLIYEPADTDGNYIVSGLDSFVEKSTIDENTTLWRGISTSDPDYKKFLQSLQPGDILKQSSYMSTSRDRASASYFTERPEGGSGPDDLAVLFKINAKKGTKAAEMFKTVLGNMAYEKEVLLPRGDKMTDSLVVTKVEKDKYDPLLLHVEFDYLPESKEETPETPASLPSTPEEFAALVQNYSVEKEVEKYEFSPENYIFSFDSEIDEDNIEDFFEEVDYNLIFEDIDDIFESSSIDMNSVAQDFANEWYRRNRERFIFPNIENIETLPLYDEDIAKFSAEKEKIINYCRYRNRLLIKEMFKEMEETLPEDDHPPIIRLLNTLESGSDYLANKIKNATPAIAISEENLLQVISKGRFLSQFESGTTGGLFSLPRRQVVENVLSGIPTNIDDSKRSIYGYLAYDLSDAPDGLVRKSSNFTDLMGASTDEYGWIKVVLKQSVKDRSTFTMQDSLEDRALQSGALGGDVTGDTVMKAGLLNSPKLIENSAFFAGGAYSSPYTELQVHGGVSVEDIEKIVINDLDYSPEDLKLVLKNIKSGLKKANLDIPVEVRSQSTAIPEPPETEQVTSEEEKSKVSEPPKSDIPFSADDVVANYINSDDGTYFRIGDTIKITNPDTGEVTEKKIETEDDAATVGATLGYFALKKETVTNALPYEDEKVMEFFIDWYQRNPNRQVFVDSIALKNKIKEDSKKLGMDSVDSDLWADATYDAIMQYAEYENLKALNDLFIELEEKYPGLSKFGQSAVKNIEAAKIFAESVKNSKVVVSVLSDYFENIIKDGRLKTQFETGTSKGSYNPIRRLQKEMSTFGVPVKTAPEDRPIYGYLAIPDNPELLKYARSPKNFRLTTTTVNHYGDLRFVLKDSAKKKTTFTMEDSLGATMKNGAKLSEDIDENTILETGLLIPPNNRDYPFESSYIESQIHNGVSLDDIEKIAIPYTNSLFSVGMREHMTKKQAEEKLEELKSIMEKNGVSIPIELVDGDIPEELLQPEPELPEEIKALKERLKKASPISYGSTVSEEKSKDEGPKLVDVNDLSDDEGLAIEYYSRGAFYTSFIVNEFLRNNRKSSGLFDSIDTEEYKETVIKSKNELNSIVDNLNNAIYKYGLIEEPITTYRGQTNYSGRDLDQLQVGDIFSEPGFSSTSLDRDISLDFMGPSNGVLFKINIPKGSYGLRISDDVHRVFHEGYKDADRKFYSKNNMEEKEILLPSGTQYKIKSINLVGENYEIEVDVVPQEKKIVKPKGPVKEVKVKKIKPSRLATKEELDNLFKKAEDPRVSPETKSVIEELSNKKETIDRATVKDVLEMIKEDIEFKKLLEELKDSEPPKSDVPFSTDDVVKDYINSDDGTYFRVGDTIKRKNPITGEVQETEIETEDDAFVAGGTLSYLANGENILLSDLRDFNEKQVIDFIDDWNKRNPNRRVYVDSSKLRSKILEDSKKLGMDFFGPMISTIYKGSSVDLGDLRLFWADSTYDTVMKYAGYENLKALTDALIEFEEKFPGVSKFAERAVKDREGVRIFAEDIKDSKVVVSVSSAFFRTILEDGRFKTQFETNFSKGTYDPIRRVKTELSTFGVPVDTDSKNRPVYAYLTLPDNPDRNKYISDEKNFTITSKAVNHYGDMRFILKDSAKKKTTFTMRDSLAVEVRNGGKLSDDISEDTILQAGFLRTPRSDESPIETSYIEAQIHNGVSLNDVEKIVIPYSPIPDRTWYSNMTKEQAEQLMEQYKSLMVKYGISIPIELVDGDK